MVNERRTRSSACCRTDFRFLRANPLVILPMKIDRATIHAAGFNSRASRGSSPA